MRCRGRTCSGHGALPVGLAAARFTRRGLAGLIAWPAAGPDFRADLLGAARPPWTPHADPREQALAAAYQFLLDAAAVLAAAGVCGDGGMVRKARSTPGSPPRGRPRGYDRVPGGRCADTGRGPGRAGRGIPRRRGLRRTAGPARRWRRCGTWSPGCSTWSGACPRTGSPGYAYQALLLEELARPGSGGLHRGPRPGPGRPGGQAAHPVPGHLRRVRALCRARHSVSLCRLRDYADPIRDEERSGCSWHMRRLVSLGIIATR